MLQPLTSKMWPVTNTGRISAAAYKRSFQNRHFQLITISRSTMHKLHIQVLWIYNNNNQTYIKCIKMKFYKIYRYIKYDETKIKCVPSWKSPELLVGKSYKIHLYQREEKLRCSIARTQLFILVCWIFRAKWRNWDQKPKITKGFIH